MCSCYHSVSYVSLLVLSLWNFAKPTSLELFWNFRCPLIIISLTSNCAAIVNRRVDKVAQKDYYLRHVCPPFRLTACNVSEPTLGIFMKFLLGTFVEVWWQISWPFPCSLTCWVKLPLPHIFPKRYPRRLLAEITSATLGLINIC